MDRLWSPWRSAYVSSTGLGDDCIFCKFQREQLDEENLVLYRGTHSYVVLNRFPYNTGHLMIAPYLHTGSLQALDPNTLSNVMQLMQLSSRALERAYSPDAFNAGMNIGAAAGAGVPDHLHWHFVPRWEGDTNFMPVLAEVKVMPELLSQSYEKLKAAFDAETRGA